MLFERTFPSLAINNSIYQSCFILLHLPVLYCILYLSPADFFVSSNSCISLDLRQPKQHHPTVKMKFTLIAAFAFFALGSAELRTFFPGFF